MTWNLAADSPLLGADLLSRLRVSVAPAPPVQLPAVGELLAGAAEVDITPPPGMPKAGYSANAHDGDGFRTRLRARVLHLRTGVASLALVQCDLLGGSAVLHHLVARAVAARSDVPVEGLLIGATHTHAAPGQFLGTDFYNRFASNRPGFDPAWTQFLAEQIAAGVLHAVDRRRPALVATGATDVWGVTRNRSLAPHVANGTVTDKRTAPQRKFAAVNPRLHLVRVDEAGPAGSSAGPLAAVVLFSVHGTGIPHQTRTYNADLWAYVTGTLARRVEASHGRRPVVGAMQATHADVAPALRPGAAGYLEAQRIGTTIGEEAHGLYQALDRSLHAEATLGAALRDIDLDRRPDIDGIRLPSRPAVGAALVAGAAENVTPVVHHLPPFRPGTPRPHRPDDPQGAKWVLGSRWLQPLVLPRRGFPRVLPMQLVRIGPLAVVALPFEITVETGARVAAAAAPALRDWGVEEVAVSSVAGEYAGYAATAEEYALQHYEGGHTLYGPRTEGFLSAHARALAKALTAAAGTSPGGGAMLRDVGVRRFDLRVHRYLPAAASPWAAPGPLGPAGFVDPTATSDGFWELWWHDGPPGSLVWHRPLVRVESRQANGGWRPTRHRGVPVDDDGWDIEVVHGGPQRGRPDTHRYRVRWYDPELGAGRVHRLVLLGGGRRPDVASDPFD